MRPQILESIRRVRRIRRRTPGLESPFRPLERPNNFIICKIASSKPCKSMQPLPSSGRASMPFLSISNGLHALPSFGRGFMPFQAWEETSCYSKLWKKVLSPPSSGRESYPFQGLEESLTLFLPLEYIPSLPHSLPPGRYAQRSSRKIKT